MGQPQRTPQLAMESLQFVAIISKMNFSLKFWAVFDVRPQISWPKKFNSAQSHKLEKENENERFPLLHNSYKILSAHAHKIYKSYNIVGRYILI